MAAKRPQLAKLTRPRLHNAVARERLFKLLDEKRKHPAVWIAGPPGAGKTMLLASYLEAVELPCVWYQVDAGDADPATFFYYLGLAAKARQRGKTRTLPLFTPEYLPDLEGFSRRFFRDFYSKLPADSLLVFDNFQEVHDNGDFSRITVEAIGQIPDGINVVFISRTDPPPAFARWLSAGTITLLGWPHLQLTIDEAATIAAARVTLDARAVQRIYEQCDGWAAGFTLILERTGRFGVSPDAVEGDSKDDVFAYFASQIFDQVPRRTRATLMYIALLPFATAPLAIAIAGDTGAGKLLEDLYRRHLFTERRGRDEPRYQFHALFREFLLERFRSSHAQAEQRELARRAGQLLEESGLDEDAIALYREAADWDSAGQLVVRQAPVLLAQGRWRRLEQWGAWLPSQTLGTNPWLMYWLGVARMQVDFAGARDILVRAFERFRAGGDLLGQLVSAARVIDSIYYEYNDFARLDHWAGEVDRLLQDAPAFADRQAELTVYCAMVLASVVRRPDHPLLGRYAARVEALIEEPLDVNQTVQSAYALFAYLTNSAQFERAQPLIRRIAPLMSHPDLSALNRAWWWVYLGYHYHVRAELQNGIAALEKADQIAAENGLHQPEFMSRAFRVFLYRTAGNLPPAEEWLQAAERHVDPNKPIQMAMLHLCRMGNAVHRGDNEGAARHARAMMIVEKVGSKYYRIMWLWLGALGLLRGGELDEAEAWLDEAWKAAAGGFMEVQRPAMLMALGAVAMRRGDRKRCLERIRQAFSLSRGNNSCYYFRWLLGCREALFAAALEGGIEPAYASELIRKFNFTAPRPEIENWPWPVRIVTLGRFAILLDGKEIAFGHKAPRKPLAVLKALVAFGASGVPEKRIADALWPDEDGDAAMESFRVALHRLRKILGTSDALVSNDGLLSLNRKHCWVDANALENAAQATRAPGDGGDSADTDCVLRLYRGHFLPGEEASPWALSMRERLRSKFIGYVARAAGELERAENFKLATEYYRRGIEADELAEEFYQGLMRCHLLVGRRSEAMSVYRRLRQTLSVTLGIPPSATSERLFQSLRQ